MTEKTYSYSTDEERYQGMEDSTESAAMLAVHEGAVEPGQALWVGENVHHSAVSFAPDGDDIIETMQERAYDEAGEFAEDWLTGLTKEQRDELTSEVRRAIGDWVTKHGLEPRFWTVTNVTTVTAPEVETTDAEPSPKSADKE